MHIEFISLSLKRFGSFQEQATLHFNSAGFGLYFLKGKNLVQPALGSNGSGKSTLLKAFRWCLSGKTGEGLKNPDITPWIGKGQTIVELSVKIDDENHIIRRTANPNLLQIDGQEAGQEYVDKLIPIPPEVIPYTIIMGQRQPLFFDLTPSEKLKVFAEPLNLERWEARSQHASELTRKLENEITTQGREKELYTNQLTTIEQDIESAKAKKDLWERERSNTLDNKSSEIEKLTKSLITLNTVRDDADLSLERAETEIRALDIRKFQEAERKASQQLAVCKRDVEGALDNELRLKQMIEQIEDEKCPTCSQPIKSAKTREQLVKNLNSQIAGLKIKELMSARDNAIKRHNKATEALQSNEGAEKDFIKASNGARDVLDRVQPQIIQMEAVIKLAKAEIERYENEDNPYKEQVTTLRKRKNTIEQQIEQLAKDIEGKSVYCERVRPWIKYFKDIKLYTLDEILQELEIVTNTMLQEFGLAGWSIHYDIERETKSKTIATGMHIEILSPNNKSAVKWGSWSGGEAQRLRIIGSIALGSVLLNHLGVSTNLAVFDEPTESLSKEGVNDLVELLANYAKDSRKSVWMIDHHAVESSRFVEVVEIIKDKQSSKINHTEIEN